MNFKTAGRLMLTIAVLSLIVACAPLQVTPETVDVVTEDEVETVVAEVEEPEDTVEEVAPETAAQEGGWCSGTDIVFFPGGSPGGPFATVVFNGAVQAAEDLGANVEYVWSDWNPEKMVTQFAEAAATQPDGIAIMGHPGDDAFQSVVDDAREQGIIVTSQNTTLPNLEAKYGSSGFGYVGAELYSAGFALGTEAVNRFGLEAGDRAMVWGLLSVSGLWTRMAAA